MARTRLDRLALSAVRTDGAILPPSLLNRIHSEDPGLGGLKPADYGLSGERVREAASRAWNALQAPWRAFQAERARLAPGAEGMGMTRSRWLYQILKALDYGALDPVKGGLAASNREFPISHLYGHTPLHLIGCGTDLDRKPHSPAAGHQSPATARMSAHGLVQLFLNASEANLWGMVSNGLRWRILRDSISLSRQSLVEFDLEMIFDGQLYDEFLLFYLLCHQSRLKSDRPESCWLETWSQTAGEEGKRALDTLRSGVERAIEALGQGALRHPANAALRDRVRTGALEKQDYYRQLLRLVYRLLFLFVAEDRGLLLHPEAPEEARNLYRDYYSSQRLRLLAERLRGSARHEDLYTVLKLVCRKLGEPEGCPELGLPALGGFLFSAASTPDLDAAEIANADLLDAVRCLAVTQEGGRRARVDYRNLGSVELGSVYESLLELHPDLASDGSRFTLRSVTGSERKSTGSYYTPDSLIQCLLDTALDPVVDDAVRTAHERFKPKDGEPPAAQAILALKVCDPAAGSGHFLIAAAHRLARRLAQARTDDEEPGPEAIRRALRDVIGRCIYGVDINPMAVELCKVALWMEALEPGRPLSFLDHHIQCGNSLLGTTPTLLAGGIPEAAFTALVGDDKDFCTEVRQRNRQEVEERYQEEFADLMQDAASDYAGDVRQVDAVPDADLTGVQAREERYRHATESDHARHLKLWTDAWCAAFVWPKRNDGRAPFPLTEQTFLALAKDPQGVDPAVVAEIERLARQYCFFHWHLAFPDVFRILDRETLDNPQTGWSGGFDVILGNPPWDQVQFREQEFFASSRPDISAATTGAERANMTQSLSHDDPRLYTQYEESKRSVAGFRHFVMNSGLFPLTGRGRANTYGLFAEVASMLISPAGASGVILDSGIATSDSTKLFIQSLFEKDTLRSLYDFENKTRIFPDVHPHEKFCLLTIGKPTENGQAAKFVFYAHSIADIADPEKLIPLTGQDLAIINPNTKTCAVFRCRRDLDICLSIQKRVPVLRSRTPQTPGWQIETKPGLFNMKGDSAHFRTREILEAEGWVLEGNIFHKERKTYLPLYEGKMFDFFDHRASHVVISSTATIRQGQPEDLTLEDHISPTTSAIPRYWVPADAVSKACQGQWDRDWFLGWKEITGTTNERTMIPGLLPNVGIGHKIPLLLPSVQWRHLAFCLFCNLSSFACDYIVRIKLDSESLTPFTVNQLPVILPQTYHESSPWQTDARLAEWIAPRALELVYTSYDIQGFARDLGFHSSPFVWDASRRFELRCEIDACFFQLYGLNRNDAEYVMDSFGDEKNGIKGRELRHYGEYRTKRVILEIYDAMQHAIHSGTPYYTRLDPPPANGWTPPEHLLREAFAPNAQRPASTAVREDPDDFELVLPPAPAPTLDIGLGEVSNDLTTRVRVNGRLGVLIAETPTGDGKTLIMVHYDGEAKPRKFNVPPAVVERLA